MLKSFIYLLFIFIFLGCGKYDIQNRIDLANNIALKNNFISKDINTDDFTIKTYIKNLNSSKNLKLYIEGDGFSWIDKHTISPNPTPINPVSLNFAIKDTASNVVYMARPCQYNFTNNCKSKYWTDSRFSNIIIKNINQAIDVLKKHMQIDTIELIGFSGGGAIVTLISSRRDDIVKITTIAGNLNHKLLHQFHHLNYMEDSLNPINIASNISYIPQIHYIAEFDKIIPKSIVTSFIKASSQYNNIKIHTIKNATHSYGWKSLEGKL